MTDQDRATPSPGSENSDDDVALVPATFAEAALLSNLLELYTHDLSDVFTEVELGFDGRYGYAPLDRYWSDPEHHAAFIVRRRGRVAGFVLVKRGVEAGDAGAWFDVAEFFVVRGHRRFGVGRRAAFQLWKTHPGRWTVRVALTNVGALAFWRRVVLEFTNGAAAEGPVTRGGRDWRVFTFDPADHRTR